MQVNITFDPASEADVENALKAVMSFMPGQAAATTTKRATGPTPDAAAKKGEQEAAAEKKAAEKKAADKKKADAEKAAAIEAAEAEAQKQAEAEAKAEAGTESTADADPLAGDDDAKAPTQAEVLKALQNYREIEGTDAVIALLKEHGATHIKDLKEEHYASVFKAAS